MKKAVICKSTSGFTRKYAEWIAEELKADLFESNRIKIGRLSAYDFIIFGGSLHAAGISGVKLIKNNINKLAGKNIIVFATGASPVKEGLESEIINNNFTVDMQKKLRFFYFRGGFDFKRLDFFNKVLMTLFKWKLLIKKSPTQDEKGMLAAYSKPMDFTKKEHIYRLIEYINSLSNP